MGRKGQSAWNKGIKMDDVFKEKCRKAHTGKKLSKETKKKIMAEKCVELWDISNGVTLCVECHNLTKSGRKKI